MARVTERLLIVAAVALLRIVQSFDGMNVDEIAAVAFGLVIPPEVGLAQILSASSTLMAIQTPGLVMALSAVVARLAGEDTVMPNKISLMIGGNSLTLVAVIAFPDRHSCIFLVCHFLCKRYLLEIQQCASQKCNHHKNFLHRFPLSKNHS